MDQTYSWGLETTLAMAQGEEWAHRRREKKKEQIRIGGEP
jgi:hypothetical protein